ncbi:MAG: hypothetical protein ORN98_07625 [Alphaproteobacteria bacterium]|nr:hypothetical protein [Alphaproteobacteria bacterium]
MNSLSKTPKAPEFFDVTVTGLSERGEGLCHWSPGEDQPSKTLAVPYALPQEIVTIHPITRQRGGIEGRLHKIITASPDRQPASCRHFGECGGCAVQHMSADAVENLKINRVTAALARYGVRIDHLPTPSYNVSQQGERRRAVFSAHVPKFGGGLQLGFNKRAQHVLVDLTECPVMHPSILALLPPLRLALAKILHPGMSADCLVTVTQSGLDLVIRGLGLGIQGKKGRGKRRFGEIGLSEREALADLARSQNLARLIWHGAGGRPELIAEQFVPVMVFAGIAVKFPPGGFLQATPSGEAMILAALLNGLPKITAQAGCHLVELFSGLGSFTLPLVQAGYKVTAFEGDAAAVGALSAAINLAAMTRSVQANARDLASDPLSGDEIKKFDILVLDPPRSGAIEQIRQIPPPNLAGQLRHIAYISCDAESFARDAAILQQNGYRLQKLEVIDQFLWSAHVELVAHFSGEKI